MLQTIALVLSYNTQPEDYMFPSKEQKAKAGKIICLHASSTDDNEMVGAVVSKRNLNIVGAVVLKRTPGLTNDTDQYQLEIPAFTKDIAFASTDLQFWQLDAYAYPHLTCFRCLPL